MANLNYPLLENFYDEDHRGHLLADREEILCPLRPRTHSPLPWDDRYGPYLTEAGLMPLARVVTAGLPPMDGPLLTAAVDRWRPETHTFHFPSGEMTVTVQDVAMILGLPIDGLAVTGIAESHNWRDMVEELVGLRPPEPDEGQKDKKTTGVSSNWLKIEDKNKVMAAIMALRMYLGSSFGADKAAGKQSDRAGGFMLSLEINVPK